MKTMFQTTCTRLKMSAAVLAAVTLPQGAALAEATLADAVWLVEALYQEEGARMSKGQASLLNLRNPSLYYLVDSLAVDGLQGELGFHPLYDGQDFEIANLRVYPDPDTPMLRGAAQIRADFTNYGAPQSLLYTLVKVQPGDVWQISDIYSENLGWSLASMAYQQGIALPASADDVSHPAQNAVDDRPWDPANFVNGVIPPDAADPIPAETPPVIVVPKAASVPVDPDANNGMEMGDSAGDGLGAQGNDLLVILDASGSMWGQIDGVAKITTAKDALRRLVGDLPASTRVGLMAYGHRREGDCGDTELLLPVAGHEKSQVADAVDDITPRGKTPISGALTAAQDAFGVRGRPANVLLISDGRETCDGDPCAAAAQLARSGIDTRVHVVGFDLDLADHAALKCVAEQGRGSYFAADNATELAAALEQVAADTAPVPVPEPAPAPEPTPAPLAAIFEEDFEGPAVADLWQVENPEPMLSELDGDGALFVAVAGEKTNPLSAEARNRYILDHALPEGDFDLVVDFRFVWQTGNENLSLSLLDDPGNQIVAEMDLRTHGCGTAPFLRLSKVSDGATATEFEMDLFKILSFGGVCSGGDRDYGNAVLRSMGEQGTRLRLSRRDRVLRAHISFDLPDQDGVPTERFELATDAITVLRLSGKPSFLAGQNRDAKMEESIFRIDHFAIEKPTDGQ